MKIMTPFSVRATLSAGSLLLLCIAFCSSVPAIAAQPVSVTDQRGQTVVLPDAAKRMVIIPIPMASVAMALDGSSSRVVGMHPQAKSSIRSGFLKRVYPEAEHIVDDVVKGGPFAPNIERLLSLRPDVVIQWREPAAIIEAIERAGMAAVGLTNNPPNQAVNAQNLSILATVIGRKERLDKVLAWHRDAESRISGIVQGIPADSRPGAVYFRTSKRGFRVAGANSYQDYWISLAGARNLAARVFKGNDLEVTLEQLLAWNPEIVFLGAFDDMTPSEFIANPALQQISAVRNKRVYKLPHGGYRWDPGSHESHLAMQWAAMVIHPQRFDFDLHGAMRESYAYFYNYRLHATDINEILQAGVNAQSAGYGRFTAQP